MQKKGVCQKEFVPAEVHAIVIACCSTMYLCVRFFLLHEAVGGHVLMKYLWIR